MSIRISLPERIQRVIEARLVVVHSATVRWAAMVCGGPQSERKSRIRVIRQILLAPVLLFSVGFQSYRPGEAATCGIGSLFGRQVVEATKIDIVDFAVFGDLEEIDDSRKTQFEG
jgi:hypothetical protein